VLHQPAFHGRLVAPVRAPARNRNQDRKNRATTDFVRRRFAKVLGVIRSAPVCLKVGATAEAEWSAGTSRGACMASPPVLPSDNAARRRRAVCRQEPAAHSWYSARFLRASRPQMLAKHTLTRGASRGILLPASGPYGGAPRGKQQTAGPAFSRSNDLWLRSAAC